MSKRRLSLSLPRRPGGSVKMAVMRGRRSAKALIASVLFAGATATVYCGNETHSITIYKGSTDPGVCTWTDKDGQGVGSVYPDAIDNVGAYDVSKGGFDDHRGVSMTPSRSDLAGITYPTGVTEVSFTAKDSKGNSGDACAVVVDVKDNEPPRFQAPAGDAAAPSPCGKDIQLKTDGDKCNKYYAYPEPVLTDNCGKAEILSKPKQPASGFLYPVGKTPVEYTARDDSLNAAKCAFTVSVRDAEAPKLACTDSVTVDAPDFATTEGKRVCVGKAAVSFKCSASDNCAAAQSYSCSVRSGSLLPVGNHAITCEAKDKGGNVAKRTVQVNVRDRIKPVFETACPKDQTWIVREGDQQGPTWKVPTAVDNSCGKVTVAEVNGRVPGAVLDAGVYAITYIAADASGNEASCSFSVTVTDARAPVISGCPTKNVVASQGRRWAQAKATWGTISAKDSDGSTLKLDGEYVSGMYFPTGTTPVTFTASSTKTGRKASCTFSVVVEDVEAPTIGSHALACPEGKIGVPPYLQCGGKVLPILSRVGSVNKIGPVHDFKGSSACCNDAYECRGDALFKACLPKQQ